MSLRKFLLNRFLLPKPFDWRWAPGSPLRADFICSQAFGRNTYCDRDVGTIIRTARERFVDDITTFEWFRSQHFIPGRPNMLLADLCYDLSNTLDKPIIGQWEVMYDLYCSVPAWYIGRKDHLIAIWPPDEGYLGTREFFLKTKRIADSRAWKTPLLVAHPEHIQRCYFLGRKVFGGNPAITTGLVSNEWFDPKSVQRWTRGKWLWLFYELFLARPHHRLHGWM